MKETTKLLLIGGAVVAAIVLLSRPATGVNQVVPYYDASKESCETCGGE